VDLIDRIGKGKVRRNVERCGCREGREDGEDSSELLSVRLKSWRKDEY
jgi:hypothetical protein